METLVSFLLASVVTFFFVRRYLKNLTAPRKHIAKAGDHAHSAAPAKMHPCPRCAKAIPQDAAFCSHCGAALAMWTVHRAVVQSASAGAPKGTARPVINASLCIGCGSCVDVCPEQGTLELVGGKAILSHPDRCTGHAKCTEVCPTQAIALSIGGALQTMKVPLVREDFETNVEGLFIIGELAGMGLIKTAVNEGKLVMDHVKKRLEKEGRSFPTNGNGTHDGTGAQGATVQPAANADGSVDVLIVGAGPAGLSASLTAQQYGLTYLTLEQGEIASTIRQYPRHKFLMAEPVEIPLYGPLYVNYGSKEGLLAVWETIIANTGVRIQTQERVERIVRNGGNFRVETAKHEYHARYVALAMGRRGTPRRLRVSGEDLAKVSYRLIEAGDYDKKDLLVVGGGDSAIEAALALSRSGKNRVTLSYRGADFHRTRPRNQQQLEAVEQEGRLRVLRNSQVQEILPASVRLTAGKETLELPNDFAFILIGGESPEDFLRKAGVEIVEKVLSV